MAKNTVDILLRCLRAQASRRAADGQTDECLLERFVRQRDAAAFAALLERHGQMVLDVCRGTLGDDHLAEDVFQATFLVLIQSAGAIRKRRSLGAWLHGAALRLARRARTDAARAGRADMRPCHEPPPGPGAEASRREAREILAEELQRLPQRYRLPLVLCYLEGRTRDEAAAALGWTPGQLKGLLERGREQLRGRLIRRGLAPAAAGAALLAEAALAAPVSRLLAVATLQAAHRLAAGEVLGDCGVSGTVIGLTNGGLATMRAQKVSVLLLSFVLMLGLLGAGAGLLSLRSGQAAEVGRRAADPEGKLASVPKVGVSKSASRIAAQDTQTEMDKPKPGQAAPAQAKDNDHAKPGRAVRKYEVVTEPTQPAGSPVLLRIILTNTGKEFLPYWIPLGPANYPPVMMRAKVTDASGKVRDMPLSNGQGLSGSGVGGSLGPGDSLTIPAALAPLPKGKYVLAIDGTSAKVRVVDDAALLEQRERDLTVRVGNGDPFAQYVTSAYLTPTLRERCLRSLSSADVDSAWRVALTLNRVDRLPANALPLLVKAVDKQLSVPRPWQGHRSDLLGLLATLAGRIGSDQALDAVAKVAHTEAGAQAGIGALGIFKQERAARELHGFLTSQTDGLRYLAALTLADRKDEAALPVLLALARDRKSSWRGRACLALVNFPDDPRVKPAIESCLDDREGSEQARAALRRLRRARPQRRIALARKAHIPRDRDARRLVEAGPPVRRLRAICAGRQTAGGGPGG